jgi:hypothetical protein
MRQQHQIANPLAKISSQAQHQQPIELSLDFPLFRKNVASDNWRKDVTYQRLAEDGSSISLRYLRSTQYDQETVEFSKGHIAIDTGDIDYTRGVGEHACTETEFTAMLALGTKLLGQFTVELGPLAPDAINPLYDAVAGLKAANGARDRSNSAALRAQ